MRTHLNERQLLAAMTRFLPAGATVLSVGFTPAIFAEYASGERLRTAPLAAQPAEGDELNNSLDVPRGAYVVLGHVLSGRPGCAPLLRSVAAAGAHLVCACEASDGAKTGIPEAIRAVIDESGCAVRSSTRIGRDHTVLCVHARPPELRRPFEVVTLSWAHQPNFGDRLGIHLINPLLPAHATVRHEFGVGRHLLEAPIDLLVLGLGFSLFRPMLTDDLLRVVDHSERVIGIFGTQYRSSIDPAVMSSLLRRLDVWYARSQEDLLLYGGACRCVHLGDWLITAAPCARPRRHPPMAETLVVGSELLWQEVSLDRFLFNLQRYRRVVSSRLHPLLCALTSAEEVAYCEQREDAGGGASGKFRSMLLDVFGVHHPPDEFFEVDREAVRRYRAGVEARVRALSADIRRACAGRDIRRTPPANTLGATA